MEKLKRCYSEKVRLPVTSLTFLFNGERINDDETPMSLEMVQADVIDVCRIKPLEWTMNSLNKVAADVTRVEEARSSLSKNKEELEEEVQNLRPMAVLNKNLRKEMEKSQKDVEALRRDRAKERNENEEMFSSLKNEMAKKLEEKEKVIVGQNSQLKALNTELSQEKQRTRSIEGDVPLEKNMLERKISEQGKELSRYRSEIEHSQSELKKHRVNLTMMKSGLNILIGDPTTPSSMVESLKLLRRSAMLVDIEKKIKAEKRPKDEYQEGPLEKKVKLEEKQEYFEEHVKQEQTDGEEAENIPEYIPLVTSTSGEERGDNGDSDKD